jgi:hypothetical protein
VIDPVLIIQQLRYLARLEPIQYNFDKVIPAETRQGAIGFLFGDRLFLEIGRRLDVIFETSTPTSHP